VSKPAYIVFSDAVLRAMAQTKPTSPEALLALNGVGPAKLERYGEPFLEAVAGYLGEEGGTYVTPDP